MEPLRRATEAHDVEGIIALLAPDVVLLSPIVRRARFEGRDEVADLLRVVFTVLHDIRFTETVAEGERTQVVFWRGKVLGLHLEEANLLRLDDAGRIREMTLFMRPLASLAFLAVVVTPRILLRGRSARRALLRGAGRPRRPSGPPGPPPARSR